jgi:hypothetical protein
MLYLMMDRTNQEYLVKVGYSKGGTKQRRQQYYGYNPRAIMRSSCAGSRSMETSCRKMLTEWGATRIERTEWFVVSKEMFEKLYNEGMSIFRPSYKTIHFLEDFNYL